MTASVQHPNEQLVHKFYACFQARDAAGMSACYHPQVEFSDPVFGRLHGPQASAMWHMLCGRARDLAITCEGVRADQDRGSAHWEARSTWGKTGRPVHNLIEAAFVFRDGLIVQHDDRFSLWRWTRMALGPAGLLLGWTPMLQGAVRKEARRGLDQFIQKQKA
jgi:ketosteroid isomerase-like protein